MESRDSSTRGMQEKWFENGYWYKRDLLGGEAVTEHIVSCFERSLGLENYVFYSLTKSEFICESKDFQGDLELVFFNSMIKKLYSEREHEKFLNRAFNKKPLEENIDFIADVISRFSNIEKEKIEEFFKTLFYVDALVCNVDRHFNNFGILKAKDGTSKMIPFFDFGQSLGVSEDSKIHDKRNVYTVLSKGLRLKPFDYNSNTLKKRLGNQVDLSMNLDVFFESLDKRVLDSRRLNIFKQRIFTELSEEEKSLFQKRLNEERNKYNGEL